MIHKVIAEEESYAHNITADTFSHTSNTQRENANVILTSEKLDKSDDLAETLNYLTINDAEYYVSDSENANDSKDNPARYPKTVTHTSDKKKRRVLYTSNRISQQKLLNKLTLRVITTTMNHKIQNRIATCRGTTHTLATPETKDLIRDTVQIISKVNRTPRNVIQIGRDGSTPGNIGIYVRSNQAHSPVLIGSTTVSPACGIRGILQVEAATANPGGTRKTDNPLKGIRNPIP